MNNTTTPGDDREAAAVLAQFDKAISGLQNDVPSTQQFVYKQTAYTPTTFVPILQAAAAPLRAVVTARGALATALNNRHAAFPDAMALISGFFALVPNILPAGADVTQFGAKPRKPRKQLTAEQQVAANQQRQATRKARNIMGSKQRAAIKAPAPAAPAAPAPRPAPRPPRRRRALDRRTRVLRPPSSLAIHCHAVALPDSAVRSIATAESSPAWAARRRSSWRMR